MFAGTSLSQKEVKIKNACAQTHTHKHVCAHTQGHTLTLSSHWFHLVILSFASLLSLARIHTLHLQMQKEFFLSIIKRIRGPQCPGWDRTDDPHCVGPSLQGPKDLAFSWHSASACLSQVAEDGATLPGASQLTGTDVLCWDFSSHPLQ